MFSTTQDNSDERTRNDGGAPAGTGAVRSSARCTTRVLRAIGLTGVAGGLAAWLMPEPLAYETAGPGLRWLLFAFGVVLLFIGLVQPVRRMTRTDDAAENNSRENEAGAESVPVAPPTEQGEVRVANRWWSGDGPPVNRWFITLVILGATTLSLSAMYLGGMLEFVGVVAVLAPGMLIAMVGTRRIVPKFSNANPAMVAGAVGGFIAALGADLARSHVVKPALMAGPERLQWIVATERRMFDDEFVRNALSANAPAADRATLIDRVIAYRAASGELPLGIMEPLEDAIRTGRVDADPLQRFFRASIDVRPRATATQGDRVEIRFDVTLGDLDESFDRVLFVESVNIGNGPLHEVRSEGDLAAGWATTLRDDDAGVRVPFLRSRSPTSPGNRKLFAPVPADVAAGQHEVVVQLHVAIATPNVSRMVAGLDVWSSGSFVEPGPAVLTFPLEVRTEIALP